MNETIEITDGVVHLIEKHVVKSITLGAFKESILATMGFRTTLLPVGTVLFAQRDRLSVYVLEQAPRTRTIKRRQARARAGEVAEYTIPLPWVYMVASFHEYALDELRVYFSQRRIEQTDDQVCYAPLPNLYPDGHVCLGDLRFDMTSSTPSKVESLRQFFWSSIFNYDLTDLYVNRMPEEIKERSEEGNFFGGWAKVSEEEVCALAWQPFKPLGEVVDSVTGRGT